ncbi:MAG: hypothetical protein GX842_09390 [Spirochaetales bacterium]|nr:hypothetical protein [Spirochaetales bacterium]
MKVLKVVVSLLLLLTPLYANSLEWNLTANTTDLNLFSSQYVGQLIYQGEGDNPIEVTNIGPLPYGEASERFYYTHQNESNRWQRVLLEVTLRGHRHSSGKVEILNIDNRLLQYSGDSFTIPIGAGPDLIPNPGFVEGYNSDGVLGRGSNYHYRYPYQFITIELAVTPTSDNNLTGSSTQGIYESNLHFSGDNLALILSLEGRSRAEMVAEGHTFSIEMVAHETLPFDQLIERDSFTNTLRVGVIEYSSFETGATVNFASDATSSGADFQLTSIRNSIPYSLVFESNLPPKRAEKVLENSSGFPTTTLQLKKTTSTHSEVITEHLLSGEVGIYVDKALKNSRLPADFYSTQIYCIITSW